MAQLGVAHFVYPVASHSRFEHTLGVVHQVDQLVASINDHYKGINDLAISPKQLNLLRLTALCHDVGHGALSHVSENALKTFEQVQNIRLDFAESIGELEDAPLAEIASYYIIGSPSFSELLGRVQELEPDHGLPTVQEATEQMQRAVIGLSICDEVPLLHELVSGPFDADKLDYMTRDAQMTGVPIVTDIPRLVQKVRAVGVSRQELPNEIAQTVPATLSNYVVTGIAFSGGRTVDELILGRTLQEDKIYRHHKIRAIEAMVASMYRQLTSIQPTSAPMLPYELRDDDFTFLTKVRIEELIGRELNESDENSARVAIDLAERLRKRDLFVRAYAFSLGMPLDPYRADPDHYAGLEKLTRQSGNDFTQRGQLIGEIVSEMEFAITETDPELSNRYPDLKPYVWLDPLYASPETNDSARAYLISDHVGPNKVLRFQDDYAETVRWGSAYMLTRDVGYVFAPDDLARIAFAATEKVLRREYQIRTPQTMRVYAKQSEDELEALKRQLDAADFYSGIAYDVRPMPERLAKADVQNRVESLCETLSKYEGPVRSGSADKKHTLLNSERVFAWLRQFPAEYGEQPLQLLEEIRLIGRGDVVEAIDSFADSEAGEPFREGSICPLGEPKDSSAVTAYWSGDNKRHKQMVIRSVGEALLIDRPMLFVEDFIGSGQQSVSILETWLGVDKTVDLHENREPLEKEAADLLRKRKLGFVFAAGQPEGRELLEKRLDELDIDASVWVRDEGAPKAFGDSTRDALKAFSSAVGQELLLDPERGHTEEWTKKRALGYGNNAYLVLFSYNTPSQTLTCLWKDGEFEGIPWMPLFPRRSKG